MGALGELRKPNPWNQKVLPATARYRNAVHKFTEEQQKACLIQPPLTPRPLSLLQQKTVWVFLKLVEKPTLVSIQRTIQG